MVFDCRYWHNRTLNRGGVKWVLPSQKLSPCSSNQPARGGKFRAICDSGVGPRQVLDFISQWLKEEADFRFRRSILGLKLPLLGILGGDLGNQ